MRADTIFVDGGPARDKMFVAPATRYSWNSPGYHRRPSLESATSPAIQHHGRSALPSDRPPCQKTASADPDAVEPPHAGQMMLTTLLTSRGAAEGRDGR